MRHFDPKKYRAYRPITLSDRRWPDRTLDVAPDWCSVDLRDGNQALVQPMSVPKKLEMFRLLGEIGFREIEIGFPSASQTEYDFTRRLIDQGLIPESVTVQVLTQARRDLIDKTFEALRGAKRAIVHVYNSTSPVQREQVFKASKKDIIDIAVKGARQLRECAERHPETEWIFQYSPESFSGTEPDYAVEVCNAVLDVWEPQNGRGVVINLPATVEMTTPNVFADQVEYFCRHVGHREHIRVSLHTHNDRGCAVAAAELGLMAGADRIEGTLFGNGERTGNMDIVTMAMNLYSQGVDPQLDFADMGRIIATRGPALSCMQLSPEATRTPFGSRWRFIASTRCRTGPWPICRSIRGISAVVTRKSYVSTVNPAKAESRWCSSGITASSCRSGCILS